MRATSTAGRPTTSGTTGAEPLRSQRTSTTNGVARPIFVGSWANRRRRRSMMPRLTRSPRRLIGSSGSLGRGATARTSSRAGSSESMTTPGSTASTCRSRRGWQRRCRRGRRCIIRIGRWKNTSSPMAVRCARPPTGCRAPGRFANSTMAITLRWRWGISWRVKATRGGNCSRVRCSKACTAIPLSNMATGGFARKLSLRAA